MLSDALMPSLATPQLKVSIPLILSRLTCAGLEQTVKRTTNSHRQGHDKESICIQGSSRNLYTVRALLVAGC